ncbi:FAD:protein FMN transferase [Rhodococcus sp. KRD197]|uniref:FAD:protein FMN transferase n=1 Tax=unclassified Rhodococcus (in: high G+C Gram-positive bacteria) TaxID=192944 RepID=UPI001F4A0458|nr:FAD:protein FMN transferase [Rhodococcus sp. KRD197]
MRGAHIIDPRTGRGVEHPGSATVAGPDLLWADVWATATFIDPTALDDRAEWAAYRLYAI